METIIATILNSLAFGAYVLICWFITTDHFMKAFFELVTGESIDER